MYKFHDFTFPGTINISMMCMPLTWTPTHGYRLLLAVSPRHQGQDV